MEKSMKYENRIRQEEELIYWLKNEEKIILYGNKSLVVILLRYCISIKMRDKVQWISYEKTKSERIDFDEFVVKPIESYSMESDTKILVLGRNQEHCRALGNQIKHWNEQKICYLDYSLVASLSWKDNVKLDFLCVGFTKCGTTSLYQALCKNQELYMPKEKEILYGKWKNQYLDGPERFQSMYFSDVLPDRKRGCIEPTYFRRANFVYESFGDSAKILFLLRNPADATYSYYKMKMRRSDDPKHRMYFKKYRKYSLDMFHAYLEDDIFSKRDQRFSYDIWIKEYMQFYGKDSVMIIFFEELIQDTENVMNKIQEFIGVIPKKIKKLPHSNSGNRVSKNYLCARINGKLHKKSLQYKEAGSEKQRKRLKKIRNFIWKYTLKDCNEKITEKDKRDLMNFYHTSVLELEKLVGRSLRGIWYD